MNISHFSYVISEHSETIASLARMGEIPGQDKLILEKIMGLSNVPRDQCINQIEQLNSVVGNLFSAQAINPLAVKYVLFAHTADYVAPSQMDILYEVRKKYGFMNALCFGSSLYKCAGVFHLFKMANILFHDLNDDEYILLLVGDLTFTEILRYIPGSTVMGDASTAVLLKKTSEHHRYLDACIETYGEFAKGIWADSQEQLLFQSVYVRYLCDVIEKVVTQNNLQLSQIKYIFPHNVNRISWRQVIQALSLLQGQVYLTNIPRTAHCFGADPFINLKDALSQNLLEKGDYYVMVSMGLGATFAAMIFQY